MPFTPLLTDQLISYAENRSCFRNAPRESDWNTSPVFFVPDNTPVGQYGQPGPKYQANKNYYDSTSNILGNCTWWCWGRLKDAIGTSLPNYGDGVNWYTRYANDGGSVSTSGSTIQPGDIICFSSSEPAGHVMFVEDVQGNNVYISQSAYSSRAVWSGYACRVGVYDKNELDAGDTIDMYRDMYPPSSPNPFSVTCIGILHTGVPSTPLDPVTISIVADIIIKRGGNFNVKL